MSQNAAVAGGITRKVLGNVAEDIDAVVRLARWQLSTATALQKKVAALLGEGGGEGDAGEEEVEDLVMVGQKPKRRTIMLFLNFDKARIERYLRCLDGREPIGQVQNVDECMALASACFFKLATQSPTYRSIANEMQGRPADEPTAAEHEEAEAAKMLEETHNVVEFACGLIADIVLGTYDEFYEPILACGISTERTIRPMLGFKPGAFEHLFEAWQEDADEG